MIAAIYARTSTEQNVADDARACLILKLFVRPV